MTTTVPQTAMNPLHFEENKSVEISPPAFRPRLGERGIISYHLTGPGIVRVFIRPKNRRFLDIRTLVDWESQGPGEHVLVWDGKDAKGNVLNPALYCASVQCQPLRGTVHREHLPMDKQYHHEDMLLMHGERVHAHSIHDKDKCRQLKLDIMLPQTGEKIAGITPIVVKLREGARGYGLEVGHSARYYVDYLLLYEDKEVPGPETVWDWDTRNIPNGMHVLSVACCDHHDHMGSDSILVHIKNP